MGSQWVKNPNYRKKTTTTTQSTTTTTTTAPVTDSSGKWVLVNGRWKKNPKYYWNRKVITYCRALKTVSARNSNEVYLIKDKYMIITKGANEPNSEWLYGYLYRQNRVKGWFRKEYCSKLM